jgi:hypothetical protein
VNLILRFASDHGGYIYGKFRQQRLLHTDR